MVCVWFVCRLCCLFAVEKERWFKIHITSSQYKTTHIEITAPCSNTALKCANGSEIHLRRCILGVVVNICKMCFFAICLCVVLLCLFVCFVLFSVTVRQTVSTCVLPPPAQKQHTHIECMRKFIVFAIFTSELSLALISSKQRSMR